ncbi:toxin-antitoxin system antitoxin subunit [Brachybacterium sp. Marseille-Q7125]|uniref:FitA-like ribbon-helix-helix domain-containing protein n=1 Tax=Brachybacterium sp. Marseille-Q7125 TaxID=2932815 RepID=UPI001FF54A2C|nr:toxin-antitoxin system antitoxin subunit [Brachybacterium sp. Marseille-Q7125]
MGTLTIRNVDEPTHDLLRARAARNGRSVEAEVRTILSDTVNAPQQNLLLQLHELLLEELGTAPDSGHHVDIAELEIPERTELPRDVALP